MPESHSPLRLTLTGGRGRLAGLLGAYFSSQGDAVQSLSRSAGQHHLGLDELFINNLWEQTDVLLHLAWSTLPMSSERHVGLEWEQDMPLLIRMLKAIVASERALDIHFVFFSSGGTVYGPASGNNASSETDICEPIGWYGRAKLAAEKIVEAFGRDYGLRYTILRISNPYGFAGPSHKPQGILPFLLNAARNDSTFNVWGDGTARKDFLHHHDFCRAVEFVMRKRLVGTYNLSHGRSHSINELITLVEQSTGRTIRKIYGKAHTWDVHDSLLSNQKLREATGWVPTVELADGIDQMVAALRDEKNGR